VGTEEEIRGYSSRSGIIVQALAVTGIGAVARAHGEPLVP
jgi:hypothetical protein